MNRIYMFHVRKQMIETTYIQHFSHLKYNLQVHPVNPVQKKHNLSK